MGLRAALSARAASEAHVTSELARDLVHLLVERERIVPDAFALGLRRYRLAGDPAEVGGAWRQALVRTRVLAILRRLDREILDAVAPRAVRAAPALLPVVVAAPVPRRTTYLVAGPFDTAAAVDAFTDAVLATPGVRSASVSVYGDGMVAVEVIDTGTAALMARLGRARDLAATVMAGRPAAVIWEPAWRAA